MLPSSLLPPPTPSHRRYYAPVLGLLFLTLAFTGVGMSSVWLKGKMQEIGENPTQRQIHQFQSAIAFLPLVFAALTGGWFCANPDYAQMLQDTTERLCLPIRGACASPAVVRTCAEAQPVLTYSPMYAQTARARTHTHSHTQARVS